MHGKTLLFWVLLRRTANRQTLIICAGASVVTALVGPFGTFEGFGGIGNFFYWFAIIGLTTLSICVCHAVIGALLGTSTGILFQSLVFASGAVCGGTAVEMVLRLLKGVDADRPSWLLLICYVGAIMVSLGAMRGAFSNFSNGVSSEDDLLARFANQDAGTLPNAEMRLDEAPHPAALPTRCRLAVRLDLPSDAEIEKVSADGHFIEVKTQASLYRIRMRFSDAISELEGLDGIATHRSHWVALAAVKGWVPNAPKQVVVLRDGSRVPVSRTYCALVAEQGWPELQDTPFSA